MRSKFIKDLKEEQKVSQFLDNNYYNDKNKFDDRFTFERIFSMQLQYKGVDLIITDNKSKKKYYIDEKAQLHYKNKSLPTFAFELSYIKEQTIKEGWLFDTSKITNKYFIITAIQEKKNQILSCRLISIDREKLILFLQEKQLYREKLLEYEQDFRLNKRYNKQFIQELNTNEGFLYFTNHLAEQPINIVLYLNFLIRKKIGKELFSNNLQIK